MPNFDEVKRMIQAAQTAKEREEAMQALAENIPASEQGKILGTMSKGGVNVVKLGDLSKHANNPEVYERIKNITKE